MYPGAQAPSLPTEEYWELTSTQWQLTSPQWRPPARRHPPARRQCPAVLALPTAGGVQLQGICPHQLQGWQQPRDHPHGAGLPPPPRQRRLHRPGGCTVRQLPGSWCLLALAAVMPVCSGPRHLGCLPTTSMTRQQSKIVDCWPAECGLLAPQPRGTRAGHTAASLGLRVED